MLSSVAIGVCTLVDTIMAICDIRFYMYTVR